MMPRVLLIEDDVDTAALVEMLLSSQGLEVEVFHEPVGALAQLAHARFDAIVTDLQLPVMDGIALCERLIGTRPDIPIVVLTGDATTETAIEAMRAGAFDFVTKPVVSDVLVVAVKRAVARHRLSNELTELRAVAAQPDSPKGVLGNSSAMRRAFALAARVAPSEATVLIHGETGTGKELVARSIHELSSRAKGPFIAVNCAAMTPSLLESELFGHARGAFTDAKEAREGLFIQATGGTLFLDEIGELPLELQPKLLRVLQERTVRAIGSNQEIPFDTRIVCATNRVLEDEVFEGRFREDLYYRLNVVRIDVAPLREREGDIQVLAEHFLRAFSGDRKPPVVGPQALAKLVSYPWPGNVRELENAMERAMALGGSETLEEADLPDKIRRFVPKTFAVSAEREDELVPFGDVERRYGLRVIALVGDNKTRAAQVLGMDRRTLYRKLEVWRTTDAD